MIISRGIKLISIMKLLNNWGIISVNGANIELQKSLVLSHKFHRLQRIRLLIQYLHRNIDSSLELVQKP